MSMLVHTVVLIPKDPTKLVTITFESEYQATKYMNSLRNKHEGLTVVLSSSVVQ